MRGIVSVPAPTIGAVTRPIVALHDSRTLAALAGAPAPLACELVAAPLGAPGAPIGTFVGGNPLASDWAFDAELPGGTVLAWSGTLGESLFEGTPANWMRGPAALDALCDELVPQLVRHGKRLVLVPHARHVLSDARSALTWWCGRLFPGERFELLPSAPAGPRPFGLALDLGAMLEPSMVADAEDHAQSLFASIGPRADLVILRDVRPDPADPESLVPCPLGEGVLPRGRVLELLARDVPESVPIAVPGAGLDRALAWLGRSGA
jgi:hypothetical protein